MTIFGLELPLALGLDIAALENPIEEKAEPEVGTVKQTEEERFRGVEMADLEVSRERGLKGEIDEELREKRDSMR